MFDAWLSDCPIDVIGFIFRYFAEAVGTLVCAVNGKRLRATPDGLAADYWLSDGMLLLYPAQLHILFCAGSCSTRTLLLLIYQPCIASVDKLTHYDLVTPAANQAG